VKVKYCKSDRHKTWSFEDTIGYTANFSNLFVFYGCHSLIIIAKKHLIIIIIIVLLLWTNNLNVINIIFIVVNNICRDIRTFSENMLDLR